MIQLIWEIRDASIEAEQKELLLEGWEPFAVTVTSLRLRIWFKKRVIKDRE